MPLSLFVWFEYNIHSLLFTRKTRLRLVCLSLIIVIFDASENYSNPIKRPPIPTTNRPRMITIGETFFFNNHMQRNVNSNAAKPGIN